MSSTKPVIFISYSHKDERAPGSTNPCRNFRATSADAPISGSRSQASARNNNLRRCVMM